MKGDAYISSVNDILSEIQLTTIIHTLFNGIKDKKILDVGWGGSLEDGGINLKRYTIPKLSIVLAKLGAYPVGIDLHAEHSRYEFESYEMDAVDVDKKFQDESFDAVVTKRFWSSPLRETELTFGNGPMAVLDVHYRNRLRESKNGEQLTKLSRVLKKDGFYIDSFGIVSSLNADQELLKKVGFIDISQCFSEIPLVANFNSIYRKL